MDTKDKIVWLSLLVTFEVAAYLIAAFVALDFNARDWPEWLRLGYAAVSVAVLIRWVICLDNEGTFND